LLLLLAVIWWSHRKSLSPLRGARRTAALAARAAIVLALVALSEPRWMGTTSRQEIPLLVDQSASVGNAAVSAAADFLQKADFGPADKGWIGFAGKGRIFPTLDDLKKADPKSLAPGETRLDTTARASLFRNGIRISSRQIDLKKGGNDIGFEDRAGGTRTLALAPPFLPARLHRRCRHPPLAGLKDD